MKKQTGKKKHPWIWRILFVIALGVFIYSGYQLYDIFSQNHEEGKEKAELINIAEIPEKPKPEEEPFTINWEALKAKNPEIVGWIIIPDTDINYPIVHGSDNAFYLTHTFLKAENYAGAIFMDYQANGEFKDNNTFIYGHNVKHGTMFAELENFKDTSFYQSHPYVYLFTPDGNYRCEVISMYSTKDGSASYTTYSGDEQSYLAYIDMIKGLAENKRDVEMNASDRMITLSTCSYEVNGEASDARYLLHAKMVPWSGEYKVKEDKK